MRLQRRMCHVPLHHSPQALPSPLAEEYLPVSLGGASKGEDGRFVNSPDGYLPPVHRAMQKEISKRMLDSQSYSDCEPHAQCVSRVWSWRWSIGLFATLSACVPRWPLSIRANKPQVTRPS